MTYPAPQSQQWESILHAQQQAEQQLLALRNAEGHWRGRLSASALSTATACCALFLVDQQRSRAGGPEKPSTLGPEYRQLLEAGLDWIAQHANGDGGWGDTTRSTSNPSTTLLCWATLSATDRPQDRPVRQAAKTWLEQHTGSVEPEDLKKTIEAIYGDDRTFSIPILTLCALAGVLGPPKEALRGVTALPFELAALPQSWFRFVGLPVVSYALPALIAVGQAQHHQRPTRNPLLRLLRNSLKAATLRRLKKLQPSSGGFLEAIPLTSFVTLSLAGCGQERHPVVDQALTFLQESVRSDGSWPIDRDLATWVTTLSVQALATGETPLEHLDAADRRSLIDWLLGQQFQQVHPFTGADPGGWAWTDLPGGVPDADDTPGALLALFHLTATSDVREPLKIREPRVVDAAEKGIRWLLDLQNRDGGIPTFCRGWGKLPFDQSACDLTAHTLRAFDVWRPIVSPALGKAMDRAEKQAHHYLQRYQRADGSWVPLWFGHEQINNVENPTYGTAKVLRALSTKHLSSEATKAESWLLAAQNKDGGWGGGKAIPSSIEETALAIEALADRHTNPAVAGALHRAAGYLAQQIHQGGLHRPVPIGLYFANLWYFEEIYPLAFSVGALRRTSAVLASEDADSLEAQPTSPIRP